VLLLIITVAVALADRHPDDTVLLDLDVLFGHAVANLCLPVADEGVAYSQRMVTLLIDGLRYVAELQQH
jgi:hypothetical protein